MRPIVKLKGRQTHKGLRIYISVVEYLLSMYWALTSTLNIAKNNTTVTTATTNL